MRNQEYEYYEQQKYEYSEINASEQDSRDERTSSDGVEMPLWSTLLLVAFLLVAVAMMSHG